MTVAPLDLTRQHFARLREYRRFSHGSCGLGLAIDLPSDEYLVELGLVAPSSYPGGWIISEKGRRALEIREVRDAERRQPHNDLARRIARWLVRQGRVAWLNRSFEVRTRNDLRATKHLGLMHLSDQSDSRSLGQMRYISRPDVISIVPAKRRADFQPWIIEVKVSRTDFYRDVNSPQKRLAYTLLADRVYYACPMGLITVDELPTGCGLVVETRKGVFRTLCEPPTCKTRHSAHLHKLLGSS